MSGEDSPVAGQPDDAAEDTTDVATESVELQEEPVAQPEEGSEAAKYRRRLRDTEAQRDQLAQRLEVVQRQLVERLLNGALKPEAFWLANTLEAVLTEDGAVDGAAVLQAAEATRRTLGIPQGLHVPREGHNPTQSVRDSFSDAFKAQR